MTIRKYQNITLVLYLWTTIRKYSQLLHDALVLYLLMVIYKYSHQWHSALVSYLQAIVQEYQHIAQVMNLQTFWDSDIKRPS